METLYTYFVDFAFQEPNWDRIEKRIPNLSYEKLKTLEDKLNFIYSSREYKKSKKRMSDPNKPKAIPIDTDSTNKVRDRIDGILKRNYTRIDGKLKRNYILYPDDDPQEIIKLYPVDEVFPEPIKSSRVYTKKSPYWTKKKLGLLAGGILGASAIGLGTKMYLDRKNQDKK